MIAPMPGLNLTRDEAARRQRQIHVNSYDVALDLTGSATDFGSSTVVSFSSHDPGGTTFADLHGATVSRVVLNGQELDPAEVYADHRIALGPLAEENELRVECRLPYSRTGEGLHRFVDPADGRVYLYSQFEVPDARRVFTTFEQPDLKAAFCFTVRAPEHWVVLSNSATPDPHPHGDGTATWRFAPTARMSTYITALVAGEYHAVYDVYEGPHGTIPLGHFCRQSVKEHLDVDELVTLTKQGFAFFEEVFDYPYPFGKYDQAYVPEYNMGAMENAGCVTFRDEYLPRSRQTHMFYEQRANTVLHEMAHMWFGDLVTMKWWDDLWLNESFAEWASHHALVEATKYTEAWTGFANARKLWAYRQDQLPSTHPIAADNHDLRAVEVNFDGITYAKGAATLKQLVAWVGLEPFLTGLREYFAAHAFGNSEFSDLLAALERASGRDLATWAEEWLRTSGVNTLAPEFTLDEEGRYAEIGVRQTAPADFPTLRRHRIGVGLYDLVEGRLTLRERREVDVAEAYTALDHLVGARQPDLLLLNDGDLTYAKVRLDDRSLETARLHIDVVDDSLTRSLLWSAAWNMTRDAEMRTTDWLDLVLRGIATETDQTAVARLAMYTRIFVEHYSAPGHRAELKARWEQGLHRLIEEAKPGSDSQLVFTRSYAAAATSEAARDRVAGLLDGTVQVPGLVVDTDLRWALLTALSAAGRVGLDHIDAELARDNTISGQERAAAARTVQPTAEAKATAWRDVVESDHLPNETQRSIALAFATSGQAALLEPYLEKYLAAAETIWEERGVHVSSTILEYMFPMPLASAEVLDRLDDWLATSSANAGAKRYVHEGRADMARALAAQECDAHPH